MGVRGLGLELGLGIVAFDVRVGLGLGIVAFDVRFGLDKLVS